MACICFSRSRKSQAGLHNELRVCDLPRKISFRRSRSLQLFRGDRHVRIAVFRQSLPWQRRFGTLASGLREGQAGSGSDDDWALAARSLALQRRETRSRAPRSICSGAVTNRLTPSGPTENSGSNRGSSVSSASASQRLSSTSQRPSKRAVTSA
jgi:hypothetical protein